LMGYGVGLMGLIGVKVLAPGFYASKDIRTPVRIGISVLVLTQVLNALLVPWLAQAGLALSIGLASLVNATWLLVGLRKAGRYQPLPGWGLFAAKVCLATAVLGVGLWLATMHIDWIGLREHIWVRIAALAGCLAGSAAIYFGVLRVVGLDVRKTLRR
jgi:putative peptidoglycan lipid II flippase